MSNADARAMRGTDELEGALRALFATELSPLVTDALDVRVAQAIAAHPFGTTSRRKRSIRPGGRATIIGLLAASLALGGATGRLQTLYLFVAGPFDAPWHRGAEINQSQTVDGYRVTVDRAYADATRLALAISVVDERRRPGTTQLEAFGTVVTDVDGEYTSGGAAMSIPDGAFAAVNVAWKTPPSLPLPAGPRDFHVILPFIRVRDDSSPPPVDDGTWNPWHRYPGPWVFDFRMTVDGGAALDPNIVAEVSGRVLRLERVIATPDVVRLDIRSASGTGPTGLDYIATVEHRGDHRETVLGSGQRDGSLALMTDGGVGNPNGPWVVTIRSTGQPDAGAEPWVFRFDWP